MKIKLILVFLFISLSGWAQKPYSTRSKEAVALNPNDTSYLRILNGVIIPDGYSVKSFESVKYIRNKEDITRLGINTDKHLMILTAETSTTEYKIDSILYNRGEFIASYKYPLDIQLPISINGKLLSYEEKKVILPDLALNKIKEIGYVDSKKSMAEYGVTPFGVIDLKLE